MAILSNVNGKFAVDSTGAIQFSGSAGTSGYILRSNGNAAPTWVDSSTVIGGPYLPLTGGTLSGALAGTSATFSGILTAQSSSSGDYVRLYGASGTGKWDIYGNGANLRISDNESAGILAVDTGATFGGNVQAPSVLANGFMEIRSDTAALYFANAANNHYYRFQRSSNDLNIDYYNGSTTTTYALIDSAGSFWATRLYAGIGNGYRRTYLQEGGFRCTSSSDEASTLDIAVGNTKTEIYSNYYSGGSNNDICIGTYPPSQNQLYLKNTGNVGIGTSSPSQKLHVVGKSLFTDDIQLTQTSPRIDYGNTTVGTLRFFSVYENSVKMELYDGGRLHPTGGIFLGSSNNSNLLDHYEEGTWTPGLTDGSGNQVTSGTYTRIGRSITISGLIIFNSQTSSTQFTITTFPFTVNSADGARGGISVSYSTSSTFMTILMDNSSTNARVWGQGATGNPTLASLSGKRIYFGGTYQID